MVCVVVYIYIYTSYIYVCVCVGLGGRASELQRTSGGHRIKCALRNRVHFVITTTTTWWEGACLSVRRLPAALVAAGGCVCGTRHVFRPVHL